MPGGGYAPEFNFDAEKPAGSTKGYDADNWLRSNLQRQSNAYAVEHYDPSDDPDASEDDYGRHDFLTLKEQSAKPDLTGSTNRHGIYAKSDGIYVEKADNTEVRILQFSDNKAPEAVVGHYDVPSGEIILFEKDTSVVGYTLQTDKDDMVVYITKSSAAGGETGGADKTGGTWTQPNHSHPVANHDHYAPIGIDGETLTWSTSPPFGTGGSFPYNRRTTYARSGTSSYMKTSTNGPGSTNGGATVNTWRPTGRNFTRQQRT
jgi:hypothetical protein